MKLIQHKKVSTKFFWIACIGLLLYAMSCKKASFEGDRTRNAHKGKNKSQRTKKPKKTKELLRVQPVSSNGPSLYVVISITPPGPNTSLQEYLVTAHTSAGNGTLLAAKEKIKGKFQYDVALNTAQQLTAVCFHKGNNVDFEQGKPVSFKCLYQPQIGSKKGDIHQLNVKLSQRDKYGKLVQEKEVEVSLTIKDDITSLPSSKPPISSSGAKQKKKKK